MRASPILSKSRVSGNVLLGMLLGLTLFLVSLMIVGFGLAAYVRNFIRSDEFRETVNTKAGEELNAQTTLNELTWEGSSAYANRFEAFGYEEASFSNLNIAGLRADLDLGLENFRRGVWSIPQVDISQVDLTFSEDGRLKAPPAPPVEIREDSDTSEEGFFDKLIPKRTEIGPISIGNSNIYWDTEQDIRLTGVQTLIRLPKVSGPIQVEAKGGSLRGKSMPKIDLGSLNLDITGSDFYINEAEAYFMDGAKLTLRGDIRESDDRVLLQTAVSDLKASEVLPPDWTQKFTGVINLDARITGPLSEPERLKTQGSATLRQGVLQAIPALDTLARYTSTERFRRIAFSKATADFVHENGKTRIYNIEVQSDGLARLEGSLEVENEQLTGLLQLGVIPNTLSWIPGAERKVFVDARDGHLWTTVNVSGTLEDPKHDLLDKLAAAGVETTLETLNEMLQDPDKASENAEDLLKTGMDLLNTFLK